MPANRSHRSIRIGLQSRATSPQSRSSSIASGSAVNNDWRPVTFAASNDLPPVTLSPTQRLLPRFLQLFDRRIDRGAARPADPQSAVGGDFANTTQRNFGILKD